MLCPVCLHRARVIDTRHPRRRYLCGQCDLRWSTLETLTPHTIRPSRPRKPAPDRRTWLEKIHSALDE